MATQTFKFIQTAFTVGSFTFPVEMTERSRTHFT